MLDLIRSRPLACMAVALLLAVTAAGTALAQQSAVSREVSVELRMPLGESRIELALVHGDARHLPTLRFLTPQAAAGRPGEWLRSSSVEIDGIDGDLRAAVRLEPVQGDSPERYELAVIYNDEVLLPPIRYATAAYRGLFQGRWIPFSAVTLPSEEESEETDTGGAGPGDGGDEQPAPGTPTNEGDGDDGEPSPPGGDEPDVPALTFTSEPSDRTFSGGTEIDSIVLPAASGGSGTLRYDLIHRIRGLSFNRDTRTLSGTPATAGRHLVFYTATDAAGTAANTTFTIVVEAPAGPTTREPRGPDTRPTFGAQLIAPQTWAVGVAITSITFPAAAGGNAPLRYDLDPAIPGISFDRATRTVSGAPAASGGFSMRYSATDVDGDGASIRFPVQITGEADSEPQFPEISLGFALATGDTRRITLPLATGGNGGLLYSLAPDISGMEFDADTRTLSGAPTDPGSYSMIYAVTDDDGDSDSLAFQIVASNPTGPSFPASASAPDRSYAAGSAASDTYPTAAGGTGAITYALTPDVPGMSFNAASRTHSGTPDQAGAYRMTYKATDDEGASDSLTFTITVRGSAPPDLQPSFGDEILGDFYGLIAGEPFTAAVPVASGGNAPLTYSLSGAPGLSAASNGGRISGTPMRAGTFNVTYTATDADGDEASISGEMVVSEASGGTTETDADDEDSQPVFSASPENINAMEGVEMSVVLPAATGGDPPLEYALSTVPGVEFDSATRTLSGTPTVAGSRELVYIVYDADRDIDTRRFALNVAPASADRAPSFAASAHACSGAAGRPLSCTLPAASGGDGELSYSAVAITGLPPGTRFVESTRVFSVNPTEAGSHRLTYTATDMDGDAARMTVTINVGPAPSPDGPAFTSNTHPVSTTAAPGTDRISETLPAAAGGDEPLTYSLASPPEGLTFTAASRVLAGLAAEGTAGFYSLAYTVTDEDGESDVMTIELTIAAGAEEDRSPSFAPIASHLCSGTAGAAFSCVLPAGRGGDGTLSYSLETPPQGLGFAPATRTLSGTPTAAGRYSLDYTATDADGDSDVISVTVSVVAPPPDRKPSFGTTSHTCPGTAGTALSCTLPSASGGDGTLTYWLEAPPQGLAFDASTRVLSGTPASEFRNFIDYLATDEDGDFVELSIWLAIEPRPSNELSFGRIRFTGFEGRVGEPLSIALPSASGGSAPLTYSLNRTFPGLEFDASAATLSGIPSDRFAGWATLSVADAAGASTFITFLVEIDSSPLSGTPPPAPAGSPTFPAQSFAISTTEGPGRHAISETLPAATGGDGTLTYALEAPPRGLFFIAADRRLGGTATDGTAGSYSLDYTATDADGDRATMTIEITIAQGAREDRSPTFSTSRGNRRCSGTPGAAFSCTLPEATGGDGTLSYSLETPPQGLIFTASTRVLSGTPAAAGLHFLDYTAEDADGDEATVSLTIDIAPLVDLTPDFSASTYTCSGVEGAAFSCTLPEATGGDGTLIYTLNRRITGLNLRSSTRTLSGTPTAPGNYRIAYKATDADGDSIQIDIIVRIASSTPSAADLTPSFSASTYTCSGTAGSEFSCTLPAASGGDGTLSYSLAREIEGLIFNGPTRTLAGTPRAAGNYRIAYAATDRDGDSIQIDIIVRIAAGSTGAAPGDARPSFGYSRFSCSGTAGRALSCALPAASGGDGALTYSLETPPQGLGFAASTRVLSGTASASGTYNLRYTATDADDDAATLTVTLIIVPSSARPAFASENGADIEGRVGQALSVNLATATGGTGDLTYSTNWLPDGVVVDSSTAVMSGTPTATFRGRVQLTATDSNGRRDTIWYTVIILERRDLTPSFSASTHTCTGTDGESFSCTLPAATGGDGTLRYSLNRQITGLNFRSSTRTLSGTPSAAGNYRIAYTATDADGDSIQIDIIVRIAEASPPAADQTPSFAASGGTCLGGTGEAFSCTLPEATGGDGTLTYSLDRQIPGLAFSSSTRTLSGTPSSAGSHSLTYTATDADGDSIQIRIIVRITEASPPAADQTPSFAASGGTCLGGTGEAFSCTLPEATGGDGTLTYSLDRQIPGLAFSSSTRTLSGTPSSAGSHSLTYTATDADGDSIQIRIIVRITDESPSFSSSTYTCSGTAGEALRCTLPAASGGDGTLTYSLATPPQGLSFASNRVLSGTVASSGSYNLTYTVTDEDGDAGSMTVTVSIAAPVDRQPAFAEQGAMTVRGTAGQALSATMREATGGDGPLTYAMTGTVPGLVLNSATRVYSGTPTQAGNHILTFTVTDADGDQDYYTVNVLIAAAPPPPDRTPTFGSVTSYSCEAAPGAAFSCTLPAATGGDGTLTYSFGSISYGSGSTSPQDVSFSPSSRVLTGTAPTGGYLHTGRYTATDADGDAVTITVDITGEG